MAQKSDAERLLALPEREIKQLLHDLESPLTPAEGEELMHNKVVASEQSELGQLARKIAALQQRFMNDALIEQVNKGNFPKWIFDADRVEDAQAFMKAGGYHFEHNLGDGDISTTFKKGEKVLAICEVKLVDERPENN